MSFCHLRSQSSEPEINAFYWNIKGMIIINKDEYNSKCKTNSLYPTIHLHIYRFIYLSICPSMKSPEPSVILFHVYLGKLIRGKENFFQSTFKHLQEDHRCMWWWLVHSHKFWVRLKIGLKLWVAGKRRDRWFYHIDSSIYQSIYLSIYLSIDSSIHQSLYLSIYLSIYLPLPKFFWLSQIFHLSLYVPIHEGQLSKSRSIYHRQNGRALFQIA